MGEMKTSEKGRTSNQRGMERERRTLTTMLQLFCRGHHTTRDALCEDCASLLEYAFCKLDRCAFGADKPVCAKCPVHCYKPAMRERIQQVMRYAGPRMLLCHPGLAIAHLLDQRKPVPLENSGKQNHDEASDCAN
ncbi:MAG: nitrous oxide-stimulated promoter family protein [Pirellulaceae bacterium]